ncbi:MAG: hypothetical protein IT335_08230, partial [Thermomicrobiales bacterium]|nr:hypothetical protein [Thermomicrobiales bacterium]
VSGDANVAPVGTSAQAQLIERDLPEEFSSFADPAGPGVEITLGHGIQPASPVILTFTPEAVSSWTAVDDTDGNKLPVVFASREDGSGMELADAHLLPDGSVVVTADHLSFFQPTMVSISRFGGWIGDQVEVALALGSREPECVDDSSLAPHWQISVVPGQFLWTCAVQDGDDLETVTIQNNSPYVWLITSTQAYVLDSPNSTTSLVGEAVWLIGSQIVEPMTTTPVVPPDGTLVYRTSTYDDEYVFDVSLSEPLTVTYASLSLLSSILQIKWIQAIGKAQCLIDTTVTLAGPSQSLGERMATVINCAGSVVGGLAGALLSAAVGPSFGRALDGIDELKDAGIATYAIKVSRIEIESAGGWPTNRNEGPGALWVWLGTRFMFPDWVACDDKVTYCLVGFDGDWHWLVKISGLEVVGEIADWYPDPKSALLYLGLTEEQANQILGI